MDRVVYVHGDFLLVRVREPPQASRANEAARRLLATALGLHAWRVELVRGRARGGRSSASTGCPPRRWMVVGGWAGRGCRAQTVGRSRRLAGSPGRLALCRAGERTYRRWRMEGDDPGPRWRVRRAGRGSRPAQAAWLPAPGGGGEEPDVFPGPVPAVADDGGTVRPRGGPAAPGIPSPHGHRVGERRNPGDRPGAPDRGNLRRHADSGLPGGGPGCGPGTPRGARVRGVCPELLPDRGRPGGPGGAGVPGPRPGSGAGGADALQVPRGTLRGGLPHRRVAAEAGAAVPRGVGRVHAGKSAHAGGRSSGGPGPAGAAGGTGHRLPPRPDRASGGRCGTAGAVRA